MVNRLFLIILVIGVLDIIGAVDTFGFGSHHTHPSITISAVDNVMENGNIDRYLKKDLEMKDGIDGYFMFYSDIEGSLPVSEIERNNDVPGKNLRRVYPTRFEVPYTGRYLIIAGSEAEDHPTERAQHHFLDPVSDNGLDNNYYGAGTLVDFIALFYPPAEQGNVSRFLCSLVSLCDPSFNLDGTPAVERVAGKTSASYPYNYFAWPDTRQYFYHALTAETEEEREYFFALTFFALGHSLHLLEDMGVPAHTRNDFIYDHIWHGLIRGSYLEGYLESDRMIEKIPVDKNTVSFNMLDFFWDNNGSQSLPGLAEYTNYNFLSEGTIFNRYDNPDWINIETYEDLAEDGKADVVQYYTGRTSDGIDIPHLAAVGLLHSGFGFLSYKDRAARTAYLDPYCYKDYSEIIVPRVVSYVSGLMEYFFRGRVAVIKDGHDGLRIKNLSTEPVSGGAFELYYDSTGGLRKRLASYMMDNDAVIAPGDITERITFNQPEDNSVPGRYVVVYNGRLGRENNAVIGKIIRDRVLFISERTNAPEIYLMDMDGTETKTLVPNIDPAIAYTHPVGSPDGTMFAFHSNRDGLDGIWLGDLYTGDIRKITDGYWPDWSPDGKRLVYSKNTDGKGDIYIIELEGLQVTQLTDDSYDNIWPAWSPDGSKIAYTSQRESKVDIIVLEPDGNNEQNLTVSIDGFDRWRPAWSPDGKRLAYERPAKIVFGVDEPLYVNIHVLELDTGMEINITNIDSSNRDFGVWNGTPHWMDNEKLTIESNITGEPWSDIWVIDSNGGGFIRRITDTPGHDGYPFIM